MNREEKLITENMEKVRVLAYHVSNGGSSYEDLTSEGYLALVQAARRFDSKRNDDFWLYAQARVRGAMYDAVRRWTDFDRKRCESRTTVVPTDPDIMADELLIEPCYDDFYYILQGLAVLPMRNARVFLRVAYLGYTLEEIGTDEQVHPSRISQLYTEARKKMQIVLRSGQ